jgi:hypothetical protein
VSTSTHRPQSDDNAGGRNGGASSSSSPTPKLASSSASHAQNLIDRHAYWSRSDVNGSVATGGNRTRSASVHTGSSTTSLTENRQLSNQAQRGTEDITAGLGRTVKPVRTFVAGEGASVGAEATGTSLSPIRQRPGVGGSGVRASGSVTHASLDGDEPPLTPDRPPTRAVKPVTPDNAGGWGNLVPRSSRAPLVATLPPQLPASVDNAPPVSVNNAPPASVDNASPAVVARRAFTVSSSASPSQNIGGNNSKPGLL